MNSRARQLICILLIMMGSHAHAQFAGLQVGRIQPCRISHTSMAIPGNSPCSIKALSPNQIIWGSDNHFEFSPLSVRSDTFNIVYFMIWITTRWFREFWWSTELCCSGLSVFVDGCPYQPGHRSVWIRRHGCRFGWFSMSYTRDYYGGTAAHLWVIPGRNILVEFPAGWNRIRIQWIYVSRIALWTLIELQFWHKRIRGLLWSGNQDRILLLMAINNTHIILFRWPFSMVSSCIKPFENVEDYLPVVSMDSVVINDDGNISLYGHILDEGFTDIQHAGFCYSENEEFSILENQVEVTTYGSFFKTGTWKRNLWEQYRLLFQCMGINKQGYAKGEPISAADITNEVIAPCSFDTKTIFIWMHLPAPIMSIMHRLWMMQAAIGDHGFSQRNIDVHPFRVQWRTIIRYLFQLAAMFPERSGEGLCFRHTRGPLFGYL